MDASVHTPLVVLFTLLTLALPAAAADPVVGLWKTEPDRKNLTSHIQIRQCGPNLCGKIIKAYDPSGKEVKTKNIGKELFWDVKPSGNGTYKDGTVVVPMLKSSFDLLTNSGWHGRSEADRKLELSSLQEKPSKRGGSKVGRREVAGFGGVGPAPGWDGGCM